MFLNKGKIVTIAIICSMVLMIFITDTSSLACKEKKVSHSSNISWDGNIIVHRGYYAAPQNSLQSLLDAKKNGFTMCEVDPRESSDGVIIMNHDKTFLSGGEEYVISETESDVLLSLNNGNDRYPDTSLCTLDEMLEVCRYSGMKLKIDQKIKDSDFEKKVLRHVMDYGMQDKCIFTCVAVTYAKAIKETYPGASCSLNYEKLSQEKSLDKYTSSSDMYAEIPVSEIDQYSLEILKKEAERGYKIYVYDVSHQEIEVALKAHPVSIEPVSGEEKYDFMALISDYARDRYDYLDWD